jgi:deferrochelatase/peroxidase EfeB
VRASREDRRSDARVTGAHCRRSRLDQGLLFVAFNHDIDRQFAMIQKRLDEEPMIDYITPVGDGCFFAPRGSSGRDDWVGSGLFV